METSQFSLQGHLAQGLWVGNVSVPLRAAAVIFHGTDSPAHAAGGGGATECGCAARSAPPVAWIPPPTPPAPEALLFPRWPPSSVLMRPEQSQLSPLKLSRKQELCGWRLECSVSIFIYCYNFTKILSWVVWMGEKSGSASGRVSYGLSLSATELRASKLEISLFLLIRILVFPVEPAQEEVFPDLN